MTRRFSWLVVRAKSEFEQSREIRSRDENDAWGVTHNSPNGYRRTSRRKIGEENLDAELSRAIADSRFDVFTAQIGIREWDKHASKAGDLLDRADDSLRKRSVTRDDRAASRERVPPPQ